MPTWCHVFVQTLTGHARLWFDSLPPQRINSYEELNRKFLRNFSQQRKNIRNPNEILHIRRNEDEKVEAFMERYINESIRIREVPKVMKISCFTNGVRHTQLCEKLGEEFLPTFDSLMDKVRAFVRGKDTGNRARELEARKLHLMEKGETKGIYEEATMVLTRRGLRDKGLLFNLIVQRKVARVIVILRIPKVRILTLRGLSL
jgi:hypothetical protein